MNEITFDAKEHVYKVAGIIRPSVTQIIKDAGYVRGANFYKAGSSEKGKFIHSMTEYYDTGELDMATVDEEIEPYLDAYKLFKLAYSPVYSDIEKQFYAPESKYCGTIDRIMEDGVRSNSIVIDIKSGRKEDWHKIQLCAYCLSQGLTKGWCLYLMKTGKYKLAAYTFNEIHFTVWRSLVKGYYEREWTHEF